MKQIRRMMKIVIAVVSKLIGPDLENWSILINTDYPIIFLPSQFECSSLVLLSFLETEE